MAPIATKNYNKDMPEELNFSHGWYTGSEILCSDFSNTDTEDVAEIARELSLAKSIGYCTLPRGIALVEIRRFHTQIEECYAIDPILPEIRRKEDILDGIIVRFSSFQTFLNVGSLDTLHALIDRGAQVKWGRFWVSLDRYISNFLQLDLAKGLYSEEELNKAKVLALATI